MNSEYNVAMLGSVWRVKVKWLLHKNFSGMKIVGSLLLIFLSLIIPSGPYLPKHVRLHATRYHRDQMRCDQTRFWDEARDSHNIPLLYRLQTPDYSLRSGVHYFADAITHHSSLPLLHYLLPVFTFYLYCFVICCIVILMDCFR